MSAMKRETKKIFVAMVVAAALACFASRAFAQSDPRSLGYVKPELRGALRITPQMLAPVKLNPQEQYFTVSVTDPRSGTFRYGYIIHKFETDPAGNQVVTMISRTEQNYHDMNLQKTETIVSETFHHSTGRVMRTHIESNARFLTQFWSLYSSGAKSYAPPSSVRINKTAYYDWTNRVISIKYEDAPAVAPRTFPMSGEPLGLLAEIVFLLKGKWTEQDRIYYLPMFSVQTEKSEDYYLKFSGTREGGQLKYDTVWHGFGEAAVLNSYWVIPPASAAFNGNFSKILVNPQVYEYTTIVPATKEEALKPIPPWAN
ncbi:MAG TPA: hypothetical protein PKH33_10715 [bacterium]|nr:hypothetical protein [bacterium]